MQVDYRCRNCNSTETRYRSTRRSHICQRCGHVWERQGVLTDKKAKTMIPTLFLQEQSLSMGYTTLYKETARFYWYAVWVYLFMLISCIWNLKRHLSTIQQETVNLKHNNPRRWDFSYGWWCPLPMSTRWPWLQLIWGRRILFSLWHSQSEAFVLKPNFGMWAMQ